MATNPIFIKETNLEPVRITHLPSFTAAQVANTTSDGSGTVGQNIYIVATGATDGTRVDGVRFRNAQFTAIGVVASSNNLFKIFEADGKTGTAPNETLVNPRIIGEVLMAGSTRTNNSLVGVGASVVFMFEQPIILIANQVIAVSQHVYNGTTLGIDQTDVIAFAGNY
jgi:hypothetical protein